MPQRRQRKPAPVLRFHTAEETAAAEQVLRLLDEAIRLAQRDEAGATARLNQLLTLLVNPHRTSVEYVDHDEQPQVVCTASGRVARARLRAFTGLREVGLDYEAIGDLAGLSKSAIQAIFDRAAGRRAKQTRISGKDAALLAAVKAAADSPPVAGLQTDNRAVMGADSERC